MVRAFYVLIVSTFVFIGRADAQTSPRFIALKSGESIVVTELWWVKNCKSVMLNAEPVVLQGMPDVSISIKEQAVQPANCSKAVPGAVLVLTAKKVKESTEGSIVVRVAYKLKEGQRDPTSYKYDVQILPTPDAEVAK